MKRDLTAETAEDKFDVEAEARRRGIEPYQVRASGAVNDRLMADIVADARRGISTSASMIAPSRSSEPPATGGNGWVDATPIGQPPGVDLIDRMVEAQSRADRVTAIRQRIEADWIEDLVSNKTPHKAATEYNPFSRQRMGHDDE